MSEKDRNRGGISRRDFLRAAGSLPLIAPTSALAAVDAPPRPAPARPQAKNKPQTVPEVQIWQAVCGAYLRDDFSSGSLDPATWRPFVYDSGFRVEIDGGELCLRGTNAKIPDTELRQAFPMRYVGVHTRPRVEVDVHVAVRVKMPSGIAADPGAHVVNVHLCGVEPDNYSEVLFGKLESKALENMWKGWSQFKGPYHDAHGWWFAITDVDAGRFWWQVSGTAVPEAGDERTTFHDVLVTYDEPTRLSRGFVRLADRWLELGEPERVFLGFTQVELKLTDPTPLFGQYREARFDDFRLYPNPKRNPIQFVVKVRGARYTSPKLRVALYTYDGSERVSEGYTGQDGVARLDVSSPQWMAFPVSAMVRINQDEREIAKATIVAKGVQGLYPGDVWEFDQALQN